jgi:hypothetical protein
LYVSKETYDKYDYLTSEWEWVREDNKKEIESPVHNLLLPLIYIAKQLLQEDTTDFIRKAEAQFGVVLGDIDTTTT